MNSMLEEIIIRSEDIKRKQQDLLKEFYAENYVYAQIEINSLNVFTII
jgi:hypothetical protein